MSDQNNIPDSFDPRGKAVELSDAKTMARRRIDFVNAVRGLTILLMIFVKDLEHAAPAWMHLHAPVGLLALLSEYSASRLCGGGRDGSGANFRAQSGLAGTHAGVPELNPDFRTDCRGVTSGDLTPATRRGVDRS